MEPKFEIQYYDVLELANIAVFDFTEINVHQQFINGGVDRAVENLLRLEKGEIFVLGFSIGGTIAWKASLKGLKVSHLIAVSSTRLRYETESLNCEIKLFFGENDPNKPNSEWFSDLKIPYQILKNQNHQLYLEKTQLSLICAEFD